MSNVTLKISNKTLFLEYVDDKYNTYRSKINSTESLVINFFEGNIEKLYSLLSNNKLDVNLCSDYCVVLLNEPISLSFKLAMVDKPNNDEKLNMIIKTMDSMNERISELEKQLNSGIILPGYSSVIDIDTKVLMLNYFVHHNGSTDVLHGTHQTNGGGNTVPDASRNSTINENFTGSSFDPICHLKMLESFHYCEIYETNKNCSLSCLSKCKKLKHITIRGCSGLVDMDFAIGLNELESIFIQESRNITDIQSLLGLRNLKRVTIHNAPNIINKTGFASNVTVDIRN
jgi:hypothetical protein